MISFDFDAMALWPSAPSIPPTAISEVSVTRVPPSGVASKSTRSFERRLPIAPLTLLPTDESASDLSGSLLSICVAISKVAEMKPTFWVASTL